jgi:hypothetical protein
MGQKEDDAAEAAYQELKRTPKGTRESFLATVKYVAAVRKAKKARENEQKGKLTCHSRTG